MAREGFFIELIARTEKNLKETQALIERGGGKAEFLIADLSKIDSLNQLISQVKNKIKRIEMLVNVAGIWHGKDEVFAGKDFTSFSQEIILETYSVGIITPTLLAHAFAPLMPRGGKILNISGTFENGAKGWLPYYVSKRAIEDLTIGLAEELKEKGIQVNAISPSDTATDAYKKYFPQYVSEAIEPEEIAKEAVFLCSGEANGITGKVFVMKKGKSPFEGYHS